MRELIRRSREAEGRGGDSSDDGGGGGILGTLGEIAGGSIGEALEILDVPGSAVRNAVSGGIKSLKDVITGEADGGDLLRALALITPAGGLSLGAQASDPQVREDVKQHTGVGEQLERAGISDVPVLSNDWSKRVLGFAGDVALDPLSYLAPAAKLSGGARAASKRVLGEGAERTAGRLAREAGVSTADPRAMRAITGEARRVVAEPAARVRQKGASSLSSQEALDLLGTPGGMQLRVPGTGRVARGVGLRKGPTIEATVLPKQITDPISRGVAAAVRAPRGTRVGAILSEHFAGANPEITAAARSGDPDVAVPAMRFESAERTTRQAAEHLGQRKLDEYADLRRGFRGHEDDLVDALEGSEDAARRLSAAGVDPEPMRKFLGGLYDEAAAAGIPIEELDQYFPRMLRAEARDVITQGGRSGRGFDPTKGRSLTAEKMGLDEATSQSAVRAEVERFAREELGLPDGFYEKNPDKVLPIYIQAIARRIGRQNLLNRGQAEGFVRRANEPVEEALDAASTKKGASLGRQIARGEEDIARLGDEASQQRAAASTLGEQASVTPAATDTSVQAVKAELSQALTRGGFKPVGRGVFKMTDLSTAAEGSIAAELRAAAEASATDIERILAEAQTLGLRGTIERRGDDIVVDLSEGMQKSSQTATKVNAAQRSDAAVELTLDAASAESVRIADNPDDLAAAASTVESLLESTRAASLNGDALTAQREGLLEDSAELLRAAQAEPDPALRRVAVLEAKANQAEAAALEVSGKVDKLESKLGALKTTRMVKRQIDEIRTGAYELLRREADPSGAGLAAPKDIADALNRTSKVLTPEGMRGFLSHYEKLIAYIKAWQVTTPGFHVRNFMGGAFNNYVADIDLGAYRRYRRIKRAVEQGKGKATAAERDAYRQVKTVVGRGQYSPHELTTGLKRERLRTRVNPLSSRNLVVRASMRGGGWVEELLRGALGMDTMLKGGTLDDATERIAKFHFDYADLSGAEQTLKRRAVPFYTWTRKNLPLQIEMMALRPGKYSKYQQAKIEVEQGTPEEGLVPQYFEDLLGIRTPLSYGGGQIYALPDLPFTRSITETLPFDPEGFDPTKPLGMLTPVLKTPIERTMGHQFFKDIPFNDEYREAPAAWQRVPGLMEALSVIGEARKVDGEWQMQDRSAYTVEQYLPVLGRMRRQVPSEKRYQDRALTTWLSFFGAPLRTNTKTEQELEKFRRSLDDGSTERVFVPRGRRVITIPDEER